MSLARILLVWAWGALAACQGPPAPSGRVVLLVSLDTLRADHLGAYGYPRPVSPHIDALARRGTIFTDASATAPWTLPSHASMLTGRIPSRHGAIRDRLRLSDSVPTLAEALRARGVHTGAAVNAITLSPQNGLDRGFERFFYFPEDPERCEPTLAMTNQVIDWLDNWRGEDAFVFLHTYDIHSDYCALPAYEAALVRPYDGSVDGTGLSLIRVRHGSFSLDRADLAHLIDLYDAGIAQTDDEIGRLLSNLHAPDRFRSVVVILVADHGEAFYEHGWLRHSRNQYQELLHVPLILAGTGLPAGVRIASPVSLVDLAPTIAGLFDTTMPGAIDGVDLEPHWQGQVPADRTLFAQANGAEVDIDPATRARLVGRPGNDLWAARRVRYKLILDLFYGRTELYDLATDPGEQEDLGNTAPEIAARLSRELWRLAEEPPPVGRPVSLSEEDRELLDALGYSR